jgi:phospholipid/cholesterol/gamma-HCH transport system substrate-binding protein
MKRGNDFLVGGVVIAVIVALVAALLWVKQANVGQRRVEVVARFRDAGGARVGNDALIRGVRRGRIEGIELAAEGWVHVRLTLERDVELPRDPVVLLNEASVFGEWEATIADRSAIPRDQAVRVQIAESEGGGRVLPGATLPGISKLTGVAGEIASDVATVAGRVQVAFDESAAKELRGSIRNMSQLSTILAQTVRAHASDLDSLSDHLRTAVLSLNRTSSATERFAQRMDSSVSGGDVRQIVTDVSRAASDLRAASTQIRDLSNRFAASEGRLTSFLIASDSVMAKINGGRGSLGMLVNDPSLYRNGDSLLVVLRDLAADIRANPKKYVNLRIF